MKLTQIAAKLHKTAADMEALAAKEGDLDSHLAFLYISCLQQHTV